MTTAIRMRRAIGGDWIAPFGGGEDDLAVFMFVSELSSTLILQPQIKPIPRHPFIQPLVKINIVHIVLILAVWILSYWKYLGRRPLDLVLVDLVAIDG